MERKIKVPEGKDARWEKMVDANAAMPDLNKMLVPGQFYGLPLQESGVEGAEGKISVYFRNLQKHL